MKIINVNFTNHYKRKYRKRQIYLHHTVSPNRRTIKRNGTSSDIRYWTRQNNYVNTPYIIDSDGIIYELYDPSLWAYHLGTKDRSLNKYSIGIELDSLGPLIWTKRGFTSYAYPTSYYVADEYVLDYGKEGYRGHRFYEAYTKEQIESLHLLLEELTDRFSIPKHYNKDMWNISKDALNHVPGIYSHTSVRTDKSDCHPQTDLIEMLKTLKKEVPSPPTALPVPIVYTNKHRKITQQQNILSQLGWNKNINNDTNRE